MTLQTFILTLMNDFIQAKKRKIERARRAKGEGRKAKRRAAYGAIRRKKGRGE
jgi:hypothetical protein